MWVSGGNNVPGVPTGTPQSNIFNGLNQMNGTSYDAAGNQTKIGSYTLTFDAENRITQAVNTPAAGGGSVQYVYDAQGQRVQKLFSDGGDTVYVYL